jgi:phosphoglycolate phosphatase-like HAD superfamily hydrolase
VAASKAERGLIEFDVDGVFNGGTQKAYSEIYSLALEAAGVELPKEIRDERIELKWGSPSPDILAELFKDHPNAYSRGLKYYRENSADIFTEHTWPIPGVAELLDRLLASDYCLALNTASDSEILLGRTLPSCGIDAAVFNGGIFTADNLQAGFKPKPEADIANLIMRLNNFPPVKTWMVGDSASDVLTAYYSKIEPVVTLTGNLTQERATQELGVSYIIEDVTQLESVLEQRYVGLGRSLGKMSLEDRALA